MSYTRKRKTPFMDMNEKQTMAAYPYLVEAKDMFMDGQTFVAITAHLRLNSTEERRIKYISSKFGWVSCRKYINARVAKERKALEASVAERHAQELHEARVQGRKEGAANGGAGLSESGELIQEIIDWAKETLARAKRGHNMQKMTEALQLLNKATTAYKQIPKTHHAGKRNASVVESVAEKMNEKKPEPPKIDPAEIERLKEAAKPRFVQ